MSEHPRKRRRIPPHPAVLANFESKLAKLAQLLVDNPSDPGAQAMVAHQIAHVIEYRSALRLHNARLARRELRKELGATLELAEATQ